MIIGIEANSEIYNSGDYKKFGIANQILFVEVSGMNISGFGIKLQIDEPFFFRCEAMEPARPQGATIDMWANKNTNKLEAMLSICYPKPGYDNPSFQEEIRIYVRFWQVEHFPSLPTSVESFLWFEERF